MTHAERFETLLRQRTASFPVRLRQQFTELLSSQFPAGTHLFDIEVHYLPLTTWCGLRLIILSSGDRELGRVHLLPEVDHLFTEAEAEQFDFDALEAECDPNEIEVDLLKEFITLAWRLVGGKACRHRLYFHEHDAGGGYDILSGDFVDDDDRFPN